MFILTSYLGTVINLPIPTIHTYGANIRGPVYVPPIVPILLKHIVPPDNSLKLNYPFSPKVLSLDIYKL